MTMRGGYFKSRGSIPSTCIQLMRPFRRSGHERRWGCGSEILKHYFYFQHSSDNGGSRDGVWSAAEQRTGEPVSAGEGGRAKKPQMLAQSWNVSGHTSQRHNVCMHSNDKKGTDSAPSALIPASQLAGRPYGQRVGLGVLGCGHKADPGEAFVGGWWASHFDDEGLSVPLAP